MPIPETSSTGGQSFPLVAGAARSSLTDPVALGLLSYLAYWLNTSLNAQLAVMTGHTATAVPTGRTFAYDPMGMWVRNNAPALYVWWKSDTRIQHSTLRDAMQGTYGILYVSDEIVAPAGSQHFAGIGPSVRRVLRTANDRGFHPDFGYNGDPDGTPLFVSLDLARWNFTRLSAGALVPVPATSSAVGGPGEGGITRYFPAVEGGLEVVEIVGQQQPRTPEDLNTGSTIEIATNESGDVGDTVTIMNRVLPAPDGSELP